MKVVSRVNLVALALLISFGSHAGEVVVPPENPIFYFVKNLFEYATQNPQTRVRKLKVDRTVYYFVQLPQDAEGQILRRVGKITTDQNCDHPIKDQFIIIHESQLPRPQAKKLFYMIDAVSPTERKRAYFDFQNETKRNEDPAQFSYANVTSNQLVLEVVNTLGATFSTPLPRQVAALRPSEPEVSDPDSEINIKKNNRPTELRKIIFDKKRKVTELEKSIQALDEELATLKRRCARLEKSNKEYTTEVENGCARVEALKRVRDELSSESSVTDCPAVEVEDFDKVINEFASENE